MTGLNSITAACPECGMEVTIGEYHPYAACLMFKGCKDAETVRATLKNLTEQWLELGKKQERNKC